MLRARLLDGASSGAWMEKIPGIMLALNAMVHEPHGFSASMIAKGREPTLPPDLENDVRASPSLNDPTSYVEVLRQRLSFTHQQMTSPPAPAATNLYQEGSLIFVLTTPPKRTNKLAPRWKGPFRVKRVPNPYQVVHEDGSTWRTIHVNNAKPAKLTAADPPAPTPTPEPPQPALGYLPRSFQRPLPCQPPPPLQSAAPAGAPLLFPQHQYPCRQPPCLPRASSRPAGLSQPMGKPLLSPLPRNKLDLPLPRQPMKIQGPNLDRGALPG